MSQTNTKRSSFKGLFATLGILAIVTSALSGYLYFKQNLGVENKDIIARASGTAGSIISPTTSNSAPYKLYQGQKLNFQFQINNTSGATNPVIIRLGNYTTGLPFSVGEGIGDSGNCLAYVYLDSSTIATTYSCVNLFNATGLSIPAVPPNSQIRVRLGTSQSDTDLGVMVNGSSWSGAVTPFAPAPANSTDLVIGLFSTTISGSNDSISAVYDIAPDLRLSVRKQLVNTASDYNNFSADSPNTFTNFKDANPTYSYIFAVNIENAGSSIAVDANFQDYLDGAAMSYFSDCIVSSGVISKAGQGGGILGVPVNVPVSTSRNFIIPTIAASSQSSTSQQTYLVACLRNNSFLPVNGAIGNSIAQINSVSAPTYPDANLTFPIQASAAISANADLKITKEIMSGAINGNPASSGTEVQYKITITNTSTTSTCSTPTTLVDYMETFGGVTATTISFNASTVVSPTRCNGNVGEFAVSISDVNAAYPDNTLIGSTMRVIPVKEIAPGQSVVIFYSVVYTFSSTCPTSNQAPRIRNFAALVNNSNPTVVTGLPIISNTNTNGFNYGPNAVVTWDSIGSANSVNISSGITLYADSNLSDNADYVDISPDGCRPDMRLVSKYRSVPLGSGLSTDAFLGEQVEYTITYQNYAAAYSVNGLPKSQAKNVVVTDILPAGATFIRLVSPTTATSAVSGQTVSISNLPDISLGDAGIKEVKLVIQMPTDTTLARPLL